MRHWKRLAALAGPAVAFTLGAALASAQNTVAVTEFLNNSLGEEDGREWIELYNYGDEVMDLSNWTIADKDIDSWAIPDGTTIAPGNFLILVAGSGAMTPDEKKSTFEADWLAGVPDSRVVGIDGAWFLANGSDEIILTDFNGRTVWRLAYRDDEIPGESTYLGTDDFSVNTFGDKNEPGIDREGFDNGTSDFFGYETQSSTNTNDPNAYTSDAGDTGSPFSLSTLPGGCLSLSLDQLVGGEPTRFTIGEGESGTRGVLVYGFQPGETVVNGTGGYCATFGIRGVNQSRVLGGLNNVFDGNGEMMISQFIPGAAKGRRILFQAAQRGTCPDECVSSLLVETVQ